MIENFVVTERAKAHLNGLRTPGLCFYRDDRLDPSLLAMPALRCSD